MSGIFIILPFLPIEADSTETTLSSEVIDLVTSDPISNQFNGSIQLCQLHAYRSMLPMPSLTEKRWLVSRSIRHSNGQRIVKVNYSFLKDSSRISQNCISMINSLPASWFRPQFGCESFWTYLSRGIKACDMMSHNVTLPHIRHFLTMICFST